MDRETKVGIYWSNYVALERELINLSYYISIDDDNLKADVHSLQIANLIIRIATQIESISKDLYRDEIRCDTSEKLYYDRCIYELLKKWRLKERKLDIILQTANLSALNRAIAPLNYEKTKSIGKNKFEVPEWEWNNVYQSLKHDYLAYIPKATVRILIDILGVLFILNIYFRDQTIESTITGFTELINLDNSSNVYSARVFDNTQQFNKESSIAESSFIIVYGLFASDNHSIAHRYETKLNKAGGLIPYDQKPIISYNKAR